MFSRSFSGFFVQEEDSFSFSADIVGLIEIETFSFDFEIGLQASFDTDAQFDPMYRFAFTATVSDSFDWVIPIEYTIEDGTF
ncbi:MAG: hypothetical protein AAF414_05765 [Pseudomonadota bacterium]